jgi:tape measure domain-containing protein
MIGGGLNVGGVYYDVDLNTADMIRDSRKADTALRGVEFRMGAVAVAVKALAAAIALVKMAKVADDMRLLSARVEVAAGSIERGAEAMNALARVSVRTQTALADSVQVFTRLNSSIMQMGGTQQDTLRITELLAMAIKVSGASATEAASAMTQFGQALGSGQLQGDELRSLLENAPYLMRQLADGIGVPVGALKKLGEEGKLTADVVTAALTKAAGQIEADFGRLPRTFEAAMMALVDQLRMASKAADDLSGTSSVLTGVATGAAEAVGMLADQLKAAAGEANGLGRNDAIGEWSRRTTLVLSYVADAADLTWQTLSVLGRNVAFVFQGVGREIGGIGAQIAAVMRGDFSQARAIGEQIRADAAAARSELDAADARSLGGRQLAGQAMRERMAAMATADTSGYMDRSDRLAQGTPGTLRAPTRVDPKAEQKAADDARKAADERTRGYLEQIEAERRIQEEADAAAQKFYENQ